MRNLSYLAAAIVFLIPFPCFAEVVLQSPDEAVASRSGSVVPNHGQPIIRGKADPWIVKDGDRYLWCFTENDRGISLFVTDSPTKLGSKHQVWQAPDAGPASRQVWAPELHRFGDHWYIYFAPSDGDNATHRTYVLKSKTDDPLGEYDLIGPLDTSGRGGDDDNGTWAIDMTPLEYEGRLYAIWSGWKNQDDVQYLYIAPMSDPATISGARVMMCRNDDYLWERTEETENSRGLNEAPQVLKRGKRTFVTYSCGASWLQTYKIGLLELIGNDPLNPEHWKKHTEPVFRASNRPDSQAFGVGHACFLLDGPEPLIIYHSKRSTRPGWERDVYLRTFRFDENDFPVFGTK